MIKQFIKDYLVGKFSAVLVDPQKENEIASSFFTKNGFKPIQVSQDKGHIILILPLKYLFRRVKEKFKVRTNVGYLVAMK